MSKSFEQRLRLLSLVESKQRGFGAKNPNQQGMSSVLIERRNPARRMRKNAVSRKNCFSEEMSPRRKMIERQRDDLAKKRKIFLAHDPETKRKSLRNAANVRENRVNRRVRGWTRGGSHIELTSF
jgi:hypothetical protein